eukprot:2419298-Rhodomonas_salina.2
MLHLRGAHLPAGILPRARAVELRLSELGSGNRWRPALARRMGEKGRDVGYVETRWGTMAGGHESLRRWEFKVGLRSQGKEDR